ncbi:MAG: hypothetical protein ACYSUY_13080 [Planctomycetota bacterium]|jgi:hypothetical protein
MRSAENIEKLVKNLDLDIDTNTEIDRVILSELLEAQEKSKEISPALAKPDIRRIIMKNPITKLAVAAVIIIAATIGLNHFIGPIYGTNAVFAQMAEAIEKEPCVHIVLTETHRGKQQLRREFWLLLESGTMHEKRPDGTVTFVDSQNKREYIYNPGIGKIFVIEAADPDYDSKNKYFFEEITAADELLPKIIGPLSGSQMVVKQGRYKGTDVDVYEAQLPERKSGSAGNLTRKVEIVADVYTSLPVYLSVHATDSNGTLFSERTAAFDYPKYTPVDIYDLDVPESAVVVEGHPAEVEAVLDRFDDRCQQGFGNYVAVLTASDLADGQIRQKKSIELFSSKGANLLYASYLLEKDKLDEWNPSSDMSSITNWPVPDIDELIELGRDILPCQLYVSDGTRACRIHYFKRKPGAYQVQEIVDKQKVTSMDSYLSLSYKLWPRHLRQKVSHADNGGMVVSELILLGDAARPQQIGLHNDVIDRLNHVEIIYWIDPVRDDMPVETITRMFDKSQESITRERHTRYLDYGTIRENQWYPTRWQTTSTVHSGGYSNTNLMTEYNLRIFPDMELDDWWFNTFVNEMKQRGQ